jgi:hypothetical protein
MLHQKLALQISAQLTNVQKLRPATDDAALMMRVKCSSCHEEHKKEVSFSPLDEVDVQGGKGKANFVMSCQVRDSVVPAVEKCLGGS